MEKWIDISGISIPSDENDYYELVEFADAIAELDPIDMEAIKAQAYNRGVDSERKRIADAWCKAEYERGYKDGRESAERKGEWIYTNNPLRFDDEWECSKCGYLSFIKANYCEHCGARMKGEDDE